jgi:hypothetical protein
MSSRIYHYCKVLVASAAVLVGCRPVDSLPGVAPRVGIGDLRPLPVPSLQDMGGVPLDPGQDEQAGSPNVSPAAETAEAAFAPPYPDRKNPFSRPGTAGSTASPLRDATAAGDIQLRGFANVGGPRVLLVLRGKAVSLRVGDEHAGVKVLAISPPEVTLQVGERTWTKSLLHPGSVPEKTESGEGHTEGRSGQSGRIQ